MWRAAAEKVSGMGQGDADDVENKDEAADEEEKEGEDGKVHFTRFAHKGSPPSKLARERSQCRARHHASFPDAPHV